MPGLIQDNSSAGAGRYIDGASFIPMLLAEE